MTEQCQRIEVSLHRTTWLARKQVLQIDTPVNTEYIGTNSIEGGDQMGGIIGVLDGGHA